MFRYILYGAGVIVGLVLIGTIFHWTVNRVYVDNGQSLSLKYKGPIIFGSRTPAKPGQFAVDGEVGMVEQLKGPGRHFYCPIWWERKVIDHTEENMVIMPGEVAVVRSAMGGDLPEGQFVVDGGLGETKHKGILRKVLGPGIYRANPYQYQFTKVKLQSDNRGSETSHSGWVEIPTGYVGVVKNETDNPATGAKKGVQENVLPPGLYFINGKEKQVYIVEIGFRETTIAVEMTEEKDGRLAVDKYGDPLISDPESGINYPSSDGFNIQMDVTAIWGVMPKQAPSLINTFGNIAAAEEKVIYPQMESICRNTGSKKSAEELLVGEDRQEFQNQISDELRAVLEGREAVPEKGVKGESGYEEAKPAIEDKNITLLYGLVKAIYIPKVVRDPIQKGYIADEVKLTRDVEKTTEKQRALLEEAKKVVEREAAKIRVETVKLVAEQLALGKKEVAEIKATQAKLVAAIDKETATVETEAKVMLGEAQASAVQMEREAKADLFRLAVESFGSGEAYNLWWFAEQMPSDTKLQFLYAGEGTLWTDLSKQGITPTVPLRNPPKSK